MTRIATLLVLTLLAVPAFAAEMVDNPVYQSWAKYGVGTTAVYKSTADMAGTQTASTITYKLAELTPEKAVIEMATSMEVAGQKIDTPAQKMDYPAKVEKTEGKPADAPPADLKNSEEKLETAAGAFACKVMEMVIAQQGSEGNTKVWSSDEVPGTLVKSETKLTKPVATSTTIELISLDKK